jgi:thioredoxin reductase (NADPH)
VSLDCAIIGGGPAGLTAALYLARFRRNILVLDGGQSRAKWIPNTHNQAAFPGGISGAELLLRMGEQIRAHHIIPRAATVHEVRRIKNAFQIKIDGQTLEAKTVLLATGVVNRRPAIDEELHNEAVQRGIIRYCPVCDGFEAIDQAIAVLGASRHGASEALFLRAYSADVTLLPEDRFELDAAERDKLAAAGVKIIEALATSFTLSDRQISVTIKGQERPCAFDTLYPALGSRANSSLAGRIGAAVSETGCLYTDQDQMTSIDGIYAAGDVVEGLDQIAVASGHAAVAATAIHNRLRERERATIGKLAISKGR